VITKVSLKENLTFNLSMQNVREHLDRKMKKFANIKPDYALAIRPNRVNPRAGNLFFNSSQPMKMKAEL